MNFKTVATLAAVLSAPFGLAFLAAPAATAALYGAAPSDPVTLLIGRYFGSEVLMYAAAAWSLRALESASARRAAAGALALATATGLAVTLSGLLSGTMNALAWSSVALYGCFVAAWCLLALQAGRPVPGSA